jgi:hypothetical protein
LVAVVILSSHFAHAGFERLAADVNGHSLGSLGPSLNLVGFHARRNRVLWARQSGDLSACPGVGDPGYRQDVWGEAELIF